MKIRRIVSLVSLVIFLAVSPALAEEDARSIVIVTGMGSGSVDPDRIVVSFTLGLVKKTTDEAAEVAVVLYEQVLTALDTVGFGHERVITTNYSVRAQKHPKKRDKYIGFSANHALQVTTSDPDSLDTILEQILRIEGTRIREIRFTSTKLDSIRRVALAKAVRNARADAAVVADAAGGVLGELIEITTHYPDNPTNRRKGGSERISLQSTRAIPTPITPPKISINISVRGRWRFVEKKSDSETVR
ncbi:MAG: SIMPL domain-containing protein [Bacteroidales bacterium]|nr:SIMPL domain-containing protein [Candidatus Latescibacterota bacterium]